MICAQVLESLMEQLKMALEKGVGPVTVFYPDIPSDVEAYLIDLGNLLSGVGSATSFLQRYRKSPGMLFIAIYCCIGQSAQL